MFRHILNFMRTGRPLLPENFTHVELLLEEAKYFELPGDSHLIIIEYLAGILSPWSPFLLSFLRTCVISGGAAHIGSHQDQPHHKWGFEPSPPKPCSPQDLKERPGENFKIQRTCMHILIFVLILFSFLADICSEFHFQAGTWEVVAVNIAPEMGERIMISGSRDTLEELFPEIASTLQDARHTLAWNSSSKYVIRSGHNLNNCKKNCKKSN